VFDRWLDCCICSNENQDQESAGSIDMKTFKQDVESFGFVCAVRMANICNHQQNELISRFKICKIEKELFLQNYRGVGLDYAIESSPTLKEMSNSKVELWYMLIIGWTCSNYDSLILHEGLNSVITQQTKDGSKNSEFQNDPHSTNKCDGIPISEMHPGQLSIKKLNAFRLCIILDTYFYLRYKTFPECYNSSMVISVWST
jgi:hypothetical protein